MAKRKIITIDEDLCTGCGECVTGCAEGALAVIDGKARLVKEEFCDGFGDCIGTCPTGALKIEERESEGFDSEATKRHLRQTRGEAAVKRMEDAARAHGEGRHPGRTAETVPGPPPGGCPGSRMRTGVRQSGGRAVTTTGLPGHVIGSDLDHWPVQIHLVQPGAPFFKNRELVVLSTCSPIASADIHWRFMRGRGVVVGCPKLDRTEPYVEKLAAILSEPTIPKVVVVRMEVPCCGGLSAMVREAVKQSGRKDLDFEEVTVGINGDMIDNSVTVY